MKIENYADILNLNIVVTRHANQDNRYSASFANVEIKEAPDSPTHIGAYGNGKTPNKAIKAYVDEIKGKWLLVGRDKGVSVPMDLDHPTKE